jgi:PAS domain S-box-containing protein
MELEQSEKRTAHMASFQDLPPVSILEVDRAKQVIFCNPAMQSVIERTGIDDPSIFIPGDIWELFSKGEVTAKHEYAREVRIKDLFFVEHIFLAPESGSLRVYATDITEHRKIKERLKKRDEMIKSLFDAVPETMIFIDTEGTVLLSNAVFARRLGKTISELEGTCIYDSFPPDVAINRKKHYDRVVSTGEPLYFEDSRLERYFEQYCYPVFDEDKKVSGVIIFAYEITERNKAEQALLAEKGFSESILEAMPGVVYCCDDHLHLIKYNRNFEAVTGYSAEELAKITPLDLFEGEGKRLAEERIREAFEKGESTLEADLVSKDGSKTPYFFTGKRVTIDNTQCIIGTGTDITKRKQAEKNLIESEERYRIAIEHSNDGVAIVKGSRHIYVNRKFLEIFGYESDDEILGNKIYINAHPDDRERVININQRRQEGEAVPSKYEFKGIRKDGTTVYIEVSAANIDYLGGPATLAYFRDITEHKRIDNALKVSEKKYRDLVDNALVGVYVTDLKGGISYVNDTFLHMFEFSTKEEIMSAGSLVRYRNPKDRRFFIKNLKQSGKINNYELELITKTGQTVNVLLNATLKGNIISGMLLDITKRKRAEEEKMRLESQLRQSQKMEAIGQLAGGIAHDFNNILSGIKGLAKIALDKAPAESPVHRKLELILRGAQRGHDLVSQILTFSRKGEPDQKPVSMGGIVKEALRMIRISVPSNIEIRENFLTGDDIVLADQNQIYQVLLNLCINAVHAMRDRGGVLGVSITDERFTPGEYLLRSGVREDSYIKITVSDTGHGMTPEVMERVFEPFFTTKKPGEGTGLGLSVVHGIIKGHKGLITISSKLQKGSSFHVYFPKCQQVMPVVTDSRRIKKQRAHKFSE